MEKQSKKDGKAEHAANLMRSIIAEQIKIDNKRRELYKLRHLLTNGLQISDHAKLRYMERVLGMDVDALCAPLITEQLLRVATVLGNGTFPIGEGNIMAVVNGNTIITVLNF